MILHVLIAMDSGCLQRRQQQVITYLSAETRLLKAQLGGPPLRLNDTGRRRLAALAYPLGRKRLKGVATLATPETLLRGYKRLIAQKFDGSPRRPQLGRPPVAEEIERLAVQMAEENPTWGYRRIQGVLANLGHQINKLTVRNILRRYHVEVATWHGLVTYYVLVVMELATRRVEIAGISPHPNEVFMMQCARQATDPFEVFLLGKRSLIHDRDTKCTQAYDGLLKDSGVEPLILPPRSPNLNAHCEPFVRSIKEEALNHMVMLGEAALSYAIHQYL